MKPLKKFAVPKTSNFSTQKISLFAYLNAIGERKIDSIVKKDIVMQIRLFLPLTKFLHFLLIHLYQLSRILAVMATSKIKLVLILQFNVERNLPIDNGLSAVPLANIIIF